MVQRCTTTSRRFCVHGPRGRAASRCCGPRLHPEKSRGLGSSENASDAETEYVVGEFNCSCVGISKFQAVCGEKTLADVPDEDYFDACELTNLMGVKAIEMLDKAKM